MSNYIWNIDINCEEDINKEEIMSVLDENGLKIGKLKSAIDKSKIINEIRLSREDIAWIGINFTGTNAIVEIVKAKEKPEIVREDEFCSIISDKDGVITKINAQNGTAAVSPGDVIKKGSVLVNGYLEGKYTGIRYVHAIADIEAKVWYTIKERINKIQDIATRTGNEEKKYSINFKNFKINLYKTLSKFENYDTIMEENKLKLFSQVYLPIEVIKLTNYEAKLEQTTYSVDEIKQNNLTRIQEEVKAQIQNPENIVNEQINYTEHDSYLEIEVIYEVLESIGTKEKIVF